MKRLLFLLLVVSISVGVEAGGYKTCGACGGLGHAFGNSNIRCSGCNGTGRVPLSAAEQRREQKEIDNYANSANDMMNAYNLTPQEFFAYEELIKESMRKVPIYQPCGACNSTGKCRQCGGYMNVSLDGPLCSVCGGSGICIACRGAGQFKVGEQDNPNKAQLIKRAKEILDNGARRKSQGQNAFGHVNNPGNVSAHSSGRNALSGYDDEDDDDNDFSGRKKDSSTTDVLWGILGVGVLGFLGYKIFKK